jgi:acyl dehydratase
VRAEVAVREKFSANAHVVFDCTVTNQHGKAVIQGEAVVIARREKRAAPGIYRMSSRS